MAKEKAYYSQAPTCQTNNPIPYGGGNYKLSLFRLHEGQKLSGPNFFFIFGIFQSLIQAEHFRP